MWDQIYDPLNSKFLSTCAAALPVVTLLVLIASNKVKAHIAALVALVVANFIDCRLYHAGRHVVACDNIRRGHRLLPDWLDRPQRHLSLSTDGGERCVPDLANRHRRRH